MGKGADEEEKPLTAESCYGRIYGFYEDAFTVDLDVRFRQQMGWD